MKFDKRENHAHGSVHIASKTPFRMHINTATRGRTHVYMQQLSPSRSGHRMRWTRFQPTLRVERGDAALLAQILKELMQGFGKLPENPTPKELREVLREVVYKYGEPTDAAQTNFLCSVRRLNDKKREAEGKDRLRDTIRKGMRVRTLAGKDEQFRALAEMLKV